MSHFFAAPPSVASKGITQAKVENATYKIEEVETAADRCLIAPSFVNTPLEGRRVQSLKGCEGPTP